ncbi:MAG: GTPase domain-containing protein [Thiohalocapsa sp.]|jgi:uncharacterized protein (DUF697 family)|uniref:GTPase n=1 Tax=Thiohalocapsa sp. TaxID=2497641 RepID=UPI0025CE6945|nr:GTPase domain-containing protein [Thiohalocapsa sp.]MCG6940737.1 GTPase domain-containing protein [Thiohalocapsa sp.]
MQHDAAVGSAGAWIAADAPVIWLLGKTQSGKTSIVAELTGQAHDDVGRGFRPMTSESRIYAFPPDQPVLRFLDTRGLADRADHDAVAEVAQAREQAHLLLVVLRVDDLAIEEIVDVTADARRRNKQLPVIVAQTGLHRAYRAHDRHVEPYPFDGTDGDRARPGVPAALGVAMLAQRQRFIQLKGPPPVFVPLDFTRPEQGIAPADYGAERLWDALDEVLPEAAERLRGNPTAPTAIRTKLLLPWAMMAAAANAVPVPVAGGVASAGMQSAMVVHIARRFGFQGSYKQLSGELASALGVGFLVGFGGRWSVQQLLKLEPGWGTAIVASWTFTATWAIGEAALYYFSEKAAGHTPNRAALRARYKQALREARGKYRQAKQARDRAQAQEAES